MDINGFPQDLQHKIVDLITDLTVYVLLIHKKIKILDIFSKKKLEKKEHCY